MFDSNICLSIPFDTASFSFFDFVPEHSAICAVVISTCFFLSTLNVYRDHLIGAKMKIIIFNITFYMAMLPSIVSKNIFIILNLNKIYDWIQSQQIQANYDELKNILPEIATKNKYIRGIFKPSVTGFLGNGSTSITYKGSILLFCSHWFNASKSIYQFIVHRLFSFRRPFASNQKRGCNEICIIRAPQRSCKWI